jgi:hypothetical protein
MILPTKHVNVSQSLLGLGATVLRELNRPATPSHLWERVRMVDEVPSYDRFLLALDLLYACDAVELAGGFLKRRSKSD